MARKANQPDPASGDNSENGAAGQTSDLGAADESKTQVGSGSTSQAEGATAASTNKATGQAEPTTSPGSSSYPPQANPASAELLKQILEGYLQSSTLQSDYQSLYRSLPAVVGIAAEILKKKEAGDSALDEGMEAVERVLGDARDKAEKLSKVMADQQSALEQLLNNKASLTELLKNSELKAGKGAKSLPPLGVEAAALADPKVAYQLNTLMGNINSMVQREVERQLSGLHNKASSARN